MSSVNGLPQDTPDLQVFVAVSFALEEYLYTLNMPIKAMNVVANSRKRQVAIVCRVAADGKVPPN